MSNPHLEAAVSLARAGFHVFPVHGVIEELGVLRCTCGAGPTCQSMGKHPTTKNGVYDATQNEVKIAAWWNAQPNWNIAIAAGEKTGLIVIDIDPRHGGLEQMAAWVAANGELPRTIVQETGGAGYHYLYLYPVDGQPLGNRTNWLPGVDVKSTGGYVVIAPSRHATGAYYKWMNWDGEAHVFGGKLLGYPSQALLDAIRANEWSPDGMPGAGGKIPLPMDDVVMLEGIPIGQRNDTLHKLVVRWLFQYQGNQQLVWGIVQLVAGKVMDESFGPDEVKKLFDSAVRFWQAEMQKEAGFQWKMEEAVVGGGSPIVKPFGVVQGIEASTAAPDGFTLTDSGNAMRILSRFGGLMRSTPGQGWYIWDGNRWRFDVADARAFHFSALTMRAIATESVPAAHEAGDPDRVKALVRWWRHSDQSGRMSAALKVASSEPVVMVEAERWDSRDDLLNVANGTVDLRTGEVRAPAEEDLMTRTALVSFQEDATCPGWLAFLERVQPDPDVRRWLRKAVGYSLTGEVGEKCFFINHGDGNNGKTIFLETIGMLLGDYASTASKAVFVGRRENAHPTDIASLAGVRFITCSEEIAPSDRLSEGILKSMTGGDRMKARFMKQDEFTFYFKGKLWLGTNHRPRITDFGPAFRDRVKLIPWPVEIPREERRDRHELMSELIGEGPGILRWALEGLVEWRA
jgi:putative DNA primase/helicase